MSREVKSFQLLDSLNKRVAKDLRLDEIFRVLENRYGNQATIAIEVIEELHAIPPVCGNQSRRIIELIQAVEKAFYDLHELNNANAMKDPLVTKSKLPDPAKEKTEPQTKYVRTKTSKSSSESAGCIIWRPKAQRKLHICTRFRTTTKLPEKRDVVQQLGACKSCLEIPDNKPCRKTSLTEWESRMQRPTSLPSLSLAQTPDPTTQIWSSESRGEKIY